MITIDSSCSKTKKKKIEKWFIAIIHKLTSPDCPLPEEVKLQILKELETVTVRCDGERCKHEPLKGYTVGKTVYLCEDFESEMLLFHELVHAVGGRELDSEGLENNCYKGRSTPTTDDFKKFVRDSKPFGGLRAGKYVIWDPKTGKKWINTGTPEHPEKGKELRKNPSTPLDVLIELKKAEKKKRKNKKEKKQK